MSLGVDAGNRSSQGACGAKPLVSEPAGWVESEAPGCKIVVELAMRGLKLSVTEARRVRPPLLHRLRCLECKRSQYLMLLFSVVADSVELESPGALIK